MKVYFLIFLGLFFLNSCVKEEVIKIKEHPSLVVVNSLINSDSSIHVFLSKTISLTQSQLPEISNAKILLYEDDVFIKELVSLGHGNYSSQEKVKINSNYKIIINSDNQKIEANTDIPSKPNFDIVSIIDSAGINEYGEYYNRAIIRINDNLNENNYYELIFKSISISPFDKYDTTICYSLIHSDDIVIKNEAIFDLREYLNFSDSLFNGQSKQFSVDYYQGVNYNYNYNGILPYGTYKFLIILNSTTKEYYKYKKALYLHNLNSQGGIWSNDPTELYSNIKGGLGIFAGYATTISDTIK